MSPAVAYEMLVSHSPPVFSHSPPTGFLADYNPFRLGSDPLRFSRGSCRSPSPHHLLAPTKGASPLPASPKRPCLVIRPEDGPAAGDEDPASPTRLKKRVVFADDKGMSLTHVRVMTEPSNVPPLWSFRFLAEVTQGLSAEPEASSAPWEIAFAQPAADYVQFRRKLDTGMVSLENVIAKGGEDVLIGTAKVRNLAYRKEVVVRSTADAWKSSQDTFCTYVPNAAPSAAYVLYDTFSFKLPLPPRAKRVEFCVCFRCDGQEYWDNNGGNNYCVVKKVQMMAKAFSCNDIYAQCNELKPKMGQKCVDAVQAKLDSWSEFASWTHLENSNPYW